MPSSRQTQRLRLRLRLLSPPKHATASGRTDVAALSPSPHSSLSLSLSLSRQTLQTWRLVDLAGRVDLPPAVVQKRMMLWVNQGVVSETSPGPVYRLVKDQARAGRLRITRCPST